MLGDEALCGYGKSVNNLYYRQERMKGESESPLHGPLPIKNYLKSIFVSASDCVVFSGTTPYWSVRMKSCNFRLLTWEQQIKIPFAGWVRTNNKFQIIIMGHGDSLSYFILSCYRPINFCTRSLDEEHHLVQTELDGRYRAIPFVRFDINHAAP